MCASEQAARSSAIAADAAPAEKLSEDIGLTQSSLLKLRSMPLLVSLCTDAAMRRRAPRSPAPRRQSRPADAAKLILLGDSAVGKTSLVHRVKEGRFSDKPESTIGVSFCPHSVRLPAGRGTVAWSCGKVRGGASVPCGVPELAAWELAPAAAPLAPGPAARGRPGTPRHSGSATTCSAAARAGS